MAIESFLTFSVLLYGCIGLGFYVCYIADNPRVIGTNYLTRFFIIPRNRWFNVYLHKYTGSDDDRALHDHPWWSVSFLLKGKLWEVVNQENDEFPYSIEAQPIKKLLPKIRSAKYTHRIELITPTAWTLFITGPVVRDWGFHCPKGWVHWTKFTDKSGNQIGAGCE